jgi:segregation and condensation protein A
MTYRVQLETFSGPMDLLLYLIRQNEVDIYNIPISTITTQFVSYLELMEALDIEYAAEFLVMAATLMDIKARMLLPQDAPLAGEEEEDLLDPREELVRELLEYKKFHDAALYLGERYDERSDRFESGAEPPGSDERPLEEIAVWDLFSAFSAILKAIGASGVEIVSTELSLESYIATVLERMAAAKTIAFTSLFAGLSDKGAVVGMFLAILELVRLRKVRAYQEKEFGEIVLEARSEETPLPAGNAAPADGI